MFSIWRSRLVLLLLLTVLPSCAGSKVTIEPWILDGRVVGERHIEKTDEGFIHSYIDTEQKLVRREFRDQQGQLRSGPCIERFRHDAAGRLSEKRFLDADEKPISCADGYAIMVIQYSDKAADSWSEETVFLDTESRPVTITAGYAQSIAEYEGYRLRTLAFHGLDGGPATTKIDGVYGVATVEYEYLKGLGDITAAVYFDPEGNLRGRKRLEGIIGRESTYDRWSSTSGYTQYTYTSQTTTSW